MNITDRLRRAIERSGQSQNEIAKGSGVSQGVVSRFVRGERDISLPVADRLCAYLGFRLVEKGKR
jgi:transcriptional regulator with XRE-family HTH domain